MACTFYPNNKNSRTNTGNTRSGQAKYSVQDYINNYQKGHPLPMPDNLSDSIYDNPGAGMVPMKGSKNISSSIYDMPPIDTQMFPITNAKRNSSP